MRFRAVNHAMVLIIARFASLAIRNPMVIVKLARSPDVLNVGILLPNVTNAFQNITLSMGGAAIVMVKH